MSPDVTSEARISTLDRVLDDRSSTPGLAADLFAVVDAMDEQVGLRRALTDPSLTPDERKQLAHSLFGGKVGEQAVAVLAEGSALRWHSGRSLAAAVERQAVRAELAAAQNAGQLDSTEEELFRFGRTVAGDPKLRAAIHNDRMPIEARQGLISSLVSGKVSAVAETLLRRAVLGRDRNFDHTLEGYLNLAAEQRQRGVATVTVARPLTDEQAARLRAALSRQVGRDMTLHQIVDESVLGGIRVEVGDEVIEGTMASRLEEARRLFR
ncbi:F0F1 ATP synthase subunit delta [Enemella sp. A6]|uniref:F0F1 ATP synthase subunit delta n=1 Tax=Enemella sp. A6 TaxID=3440152 RepID=UPI003EB9AA89